MLDGIRACDGVLQRAHDLPDATTLVMQGIILVVILSSEAIRPSALSATEGATGMSNDEVGLFGILFPVLGGAIRVGTPFLFVSLGECLTERSGRINLGPEGNLIMARCLRTACRTGLARPGWVWPPLQVSELCLVWCMRFYVNNSGLTTSR